MQLMKSDCEDKDDVYRTIHHNHALFVYIHCIFYCFMYRHQRYGTELLLTEKQVT